MANSGILNGYTQNACQVSLMCALTTPQLLEHDDCIGGRTIQTNNLEQHMASRKKQKGPSNVPGIIFFYSNNTSSKRQKTAKGSHKGQKRALEDMQYICCLVQDVFASFDISMDGHKVHISKACIGMGMADEPRCMHIYLPLSS